MFVWPLPTGEFLKEEVYSEESGYQKGKATEDGSLQHSRHTKHILNFLKPNTYYPRLRGQVTPSTLLDVGCSNGDFLVAVKKEGLEVAGVELNPRTGKQAQSRGLNVKVGTLTEAHYESEKFDVVHLGDVIEHVPDPRALIQECKRTLKHSGQLIISTPNTDCFWAHVTLWLYKMFNIPWATATPPHHLFLFNSNNLDELLSQCGFSRTTKWFEKPPRLLYELGNTHLWGKFKREKSFKNLSFLIFAFALYSLLYILNFIIGPFLGKNFGQIGVYQKQDA